jgi:hypothetical protein
MTDTPIDGLSIPSFSFGRNIHSRTLSLTATLTLRDGPEWLVGAPVDVSVRPVRILLFTSLTICNLFPDHGGRRIQDDCPERGWHWRHHGGRSRVWVRVWDAVALCALPHRAITLAGGHAKDLSCHAGAHFSTLKLHVNQLLVH